MAGSLLQPGATFYYLLCSAGAVELLHAARGFRCPVRVRVWKGSGEDRGVRVQAAKAQRALGTQLSLLQPVGRQDVLQRRPE